MSKQTNKRIIKLFFTNASETIHKMDLLHSSTFSMPNMLSMMNIHAWEREKNIHTDIEDNAVQKKAAYSHSDL